MRTRILLLAGVLALLAWPSASQVGGLYWLCNPPSGYCPVSSTYPLPTNASAGSPGTVTPVNKGGSVAAGGSAQPAAATNVNRKGFVIQNPCTAAGEGIAAAEDLYVSVTGSATVAGAGNFADLPPCASATLMIAPNTVITAAVSVNAATIGHVWNATEVQ